MMGAFSLMGHTLGGFVVIMIILAWLAWGVLQRARWKNLVVVLAAILLGLLLAGAHYIDLYLSTGTVMGDSSGQIALAGTPLEDKTIPVLAEDRLRAMDATLAQRMGMVLQRDHYRLSIIGLLIAAAAVIAGIVKRDWLPNHFSFIALSVFTILMPFTGILDTSVYSMSRAFASNVRYMLHWYAFVGVLAAGMIMFAHQRLMSRNRTLWRAVGAAGLTVITLVVAVTAYNTIQTEWRIRDDGDEFPQTIQVFHEILQNMPEDKRILMNDGRYTYYLGRQVMVRYSRPTWDITRAQSVDEAQNALSNANIGAIVLNEEEIRGWWDQLPLYGFLSESNHAALIYSDNQFRVYGVAENHSEQRHLVESCLHQTGCQIPATELVNTAAKLQTDDLFAAYDNLLDGDWDHVIQIYESTLDPDLNDVSIYMVLAKAYQVQNRTADALAMYRKITALSEHTMGLRDYLAAEMELSPSIALAYATSGETFQTTVDPNVAYNLLELLEESVEASTDGEDRIGQSAMIIDQSARGVLFQHPPARVAFQLELPAAAQLDFALALAPSVWQLGKGDGVQFGVEVQGGTGSVFPVFSEYIDPKNLPSQREWHEKSVNLSRWSGQTITLTLTTDPGPNGNSLYDWAGWGEPRIVQPITYDFLDHLSDAEIHDEGAAETDIISQTIDYETRPVLVHYPPSRVVYSLTLPLESSLHFGIGTDPEAWSSDKGDGTEYNIYVRDPQRPNTLHQVFHRFVDPKNNPEDRHWLDERVDLADFGGRQVEIIFETRPSPRNDVSSVGGGWSRPVLVDETPPDQAHTMSDDSTGTP
jgi:tetratricopeptide (TPR) repeat protein